MKLQLLITLIFIIISLFGCGNSNTEDIALTLVFDQPLEDGKYPSYFKEFAMPFEAENCENNFLLKPIYFVRADIKRTEIESNAWYFKDIGTNTVEFSTNFLTQYFTDSITSKYLTSATKNKKTSIDSYLKSEDEVVFLYSEESEMDEYNGTPIYHVAKKIQKKIRETSCDNSSGKVIIIVNPQELLAVSSPIDSTEIIIPPPPTGDPCEISTVADGLDLKDDLLKIINTAIGYNKRDQIARATWKKYFDEMASVKMYLKPNQKSPEGMWESGDGANYLIDRLAYMNSITDVNITRLEYHLETKKISGMVIVECHNASEVQ